MATSYKQDMPPRSGYGPIDWAKRIPKKGMSAQSVYKKAKLILEQHIKTVNQFADNIASLPAVYGTFQSTLEQMLSVENRLWRNGQECGFAMFGAFLGVNAFTWTYAFYRLQQVKQMNLEVTESRIALEPLILAEKHRMMMKQFRMIRDEENELMKDYPGWETGKLFDEPIFHNPRGRFIMPGWYEYYIHSSWWDLYDRLFEKRFH